MSDHSWFLSVDTRVGPPVWSARCTCGWTDYDSDAELVRSCADRHAFEFRHGIAAVDCWCCGDVVPSSMALRALDPAVAVGTKPTSSSSWLCQECAYRFQADDDVLIEDLRKLELELR